MRFKVERTSDWNDETQPCDEAVKGTIERWDVRTFESPEEHDARFPNRPWRSRGTDHEIVRGPRGGAQGIRRRLEDGIAWFIELDSLDALVAFYEKHGQLVLTTAVEDGTTPTIEIYDGWRE